MLTLIFHAYFMTIVILGSSLLTILISGSYLIWRRSMGFADKPDVASIAGEDVVATQFDLARAYLETNQKDASIAILKTILTTGNRLQKREARLLLDKV